jgi:hypothetical protein
MIENTSAPAPTVPERIQNLVKYFTNSESPEPISNPNFCLADLNLTAPETSENILHILVKLNNFEAVSKFIEEYEIIQPDSALRSEYITPIVRMMISNEDNLEEHKIAIKASESQEYEDIAKKNNLKIFGLLHIQSEEKLQEKRIFYGWMFSSSPSVSSLEHPIYDITALNCKNK